MTPNSDVRARAPRLVRAAAAALLLGLMGVEGCPELPIAADGTADVVITMAGGPPAVPPLPPGAAPGETVAPFTLEAKLPLLPDTVVEGPFAFDVTDAPDSQSRVGTAPLPDAVESVEFTDVHATPLGVACTVSLKLRSDAPLEAVYFRAAYYFRGTTSGPPPAEGLIYAYGSAPFQVFTGARPPDVLPPDPKTARRGAFVNVQFHVVSGVDGPVTVIPRDSGIEVQTATYDAQASKIFATLHVKDTAHTGATWFVVETASGNRTPRLDFDVDAGYGVPTVTGLFPNRFALPSTVSSVWIAGTSLTQNALVSFVDDEPHGMTVRDVFQADSRNLRFAVRVPENAETIPGIGYGQVDLYVVAMGGSTLEAENTNLRTVGLRFGPTAFTDRPRITSVTPGIVTAGVPVDLAIAGANLDFGDKVEVVGLPSDTVDVPFTGVVFLSDPPPTATLIHVRLKPSADPGSVRIALQFDDSVNTEALGMTINPAPETQQPVGCEDIPDVGASLSVSGHAPIHRSTAVQAVSVGPGQTEISVYDDDLGGSFRIGFAGTPADITAGTAAANYLTYVSGESLWIAHDAPTVNVLATDPVLKICVDATLPPDGTGPSVKVKGYVVATR